MARAILMIAHDTWEQRALEKAVAQAEEAAMKDPALFDHAKQLRNLQARYRGALRALA